MRFEKYESNKIFEHISMFEQDLYCCDYIKKRKLYSDTEAIEYAAKISSACFRQAKEFIFAARQVTLATRPLLMAYAFNNYAKGTAYLISSDEILHKNFKSHGFKLHAENINANFIDSEIKMMGNGATRAIEMMLGISHIPNTRQLSIGELLSLTPNIAQYYHHLYGRAPRVFQANISQHSGSLIYSTQITPDIDPGDLANMEYSALNELDMPYEYSPWSRCFIIQNTYGFRESTPETIRDQIATKDYYIIPIMIDNTPYWLPPLYTSYLIILTYSMLVRYHADKWYDFINPQKSKAYTLIDLSTEHAVDLFLLGLYDLIQMPDTTGYNHSQDFSDFSRMLNLNRELIKNIIKDELNLR